MAWQKYTGLHIAAGQRNIIIYGEMHMIVSQSDFSKD